MVKQNEIDEIIALVEEAISKVKDLDPEGDNNINALAIAEDCLTGALTELQAFDEEDEIAVEEDEKDDDISDFLSNGDEQ